MKNTVDTLTLTATPIPRTLQFSLLGARDLSIIQTPPPNRIPIQTEIILFNESEIKSIVNYELNRGGQIFFLHNKVEELPAIEDILHRLVPDMKICVAHGQMEGKELEDRMLAFMRGDYDLLLCTTIIENGLDIPNANTIIVNQAQNIGLSDLHQLRGRVGRSNKKAFCYLIVPPLVNLTDEARRRLRAIEEFSDLGSGFNIAMQDLDIRGAGNLLGPNRAASSPTWDTKPTRKSCPRPWRNWAWKPASPSAGAQKSLWRTAPSKPTSPPSSPTIISTSRPKKSASTNCWTPRRKTGKSTAWPHRWPTVSAPCPKRCRICLP